MTNSTQNLEETTNPHSTLLKDKVGVTAAVVAQNDENTRWAVYLRPEGKRYMPQVPARTGFASREAALEWAREQVAPTDPEPGPGTPAESKTRANQANMAEVRVCTTKHKLDKGHYDLNTFGLGRDGNMLGRPQSLSAQRMGKSGAWELATQSGNHIAHCPTLAKCIEWAEKVFRSSLVDPTIVRFHAKLQGYEGREILGRSGHIGQTHEFDSISAFDSFLADVGLSHDRPGYCKIRADLQFETADGRTFDWGTRIDVNAGDRPRVIDHVSKYIHFLLHTERGAPFRARFEEGDEDTILALESVLRAHVAQEANKTKKNATTAA